MKPINPFAKNKIYILHNKEDTRKEKRKKGKKCMYEKY